MSKLPREFYLQKNVVKVASELLGKVLVTQFNGIITSGIICETEAYNGVVDKASHAYGGRRTARTETMFQEGGIAYIYLCYGIHHLFNVVTNREDQPHAVLIRGIQPLEGIPEMLLRKRISIEKKNMGIGPGNVSTCLGLHTKLDKTDLLGDQIWIEDQGIKVIKKNIITGPRIGVDYAGEDAKLPYRFQYHF
jgi:DNA-3-methyladenine glycosylase